jgi:uncharacterized phiE125 gp8 family phage protein
MSYLVTTPPASEPVTLIEMKTHLRVESFMTDDDDYITALITAAREYAEIFCRRAFVSQQVALVLDRFPGSVDSDSDLAYAPYADFGITPPGYSYRAITETYFRAGILRVPMPRLISLDKIQYLDRDNNLQILDPSLYVVDLFSEPARVAPAPNQVWPFTLLSLRSPVINAIEVDFTCGYGPDGTAVPLSIKQAIKLICGHLYENRETILTGTRAQAIELPLSASALLWAHRVVGFP